MKSLQDILLAIIQNNTENKESPIENINKMSNQLKRNIIEYDKIETIKKDSQQKYLLQAFLKIIDYIGSQVDTVKVKYSKLDKDKMIQDKCMAIANDIRIFRDQCFYLRNQLNSKKLELKRQRIQNQLLQQEQSMMQEVYVRKSKQKKDVKNRTLSHFWQKNVEDIGSSSRIVKKRQSQFDFRVESNFFKQNTLEKVKDKVIRNLSTGHGSRRYGKSVDISKLSKNEQTKF